VRTAAGEWIVKVKTAVRHGKKPRELYTSIPIINWF